MSGRVAPVEVIIACHDPNRPLSRAVESVINGSGDVASVTVVAHNVSADLLKETVAPNLVKKVRFLELEDAAASPAGPFQFGVANATSAWVSIMGSDDFLEPGAVRSWLGVSQGADSVIARVIYDNGSPQRTPPARPRNIRLRDAVKDRLYYRSAPLGLMRRSFLEKKGLAFAEGAPTGEDLPVSIPLWSSGKTSVQRKGPAYVVGCGYGDRVTMRARPLNDELEHVGRVWNSDFLSALSSAQTTALGTKYLRIHLFGAAYYRATHTGWGMGDREALRASTRQILALAPHAASPLSIADRKLLDALLDLSVPLPIVNRLATDRRKFGRPSTVFPREIGFTLHREAPIRFMLASASVR